MKKLAALFTALMMMTMVVFAGAETAQEDPLAWLSGQVFDFSSGVGGWYTELLFGENGTFLGSYHDSEMGETGEGYPDGTVYGCLFHGRFSDPEAIDEYSWTAKVTLEQDEGQLAEYIEDGIRYVTSAPYGLEKAKTVTIYLPGTPVERLPEGFIPWSHLQDIAPDATALPYYAIWSEADEAGFISSLTGEMQTEDGNTETANDTAGMADQGQKITGSIEDGNYILNVQLDPNDAGNWRADEMAQDDSVVKLAASSEENGVFTACYEPTGDGEISVVLRHFNQHNVCDAMHTFTLLVKDKKVQEETGGSYTASPEETELDPYFSGEWLEKDTQFTVLDVTKKIEDGWDVEITSPISHGAWVIKATAYYDCDYDAFVYADGVKYDLVPGEETQQKEAETGLWGTLKFDGTVENMQLVWYDMNHSEGETLVFERAPGLPAYSYTGDDPIAGAIANMLAGDARAAMYKTEEGYVTIPCPIIHRTVLIDQTHTKVYGSFWILNYVKRGQILHNISGGEYPGVITLEKVNDQWQVTDMEEAGDGEDYTADIERFANGDTELANKYFEAANLGAPEQAAIRTQYIREYVEANNLDVTAYQDYGWDPVALK